MGKEKYSSGAFRRGMNSCAPCGSGEAGTASPHGGFYVDLTQSRYPREVLTERLESWLHQFSNLKQVGIDLRDHKLEMAPAAHYCLGGIKIDEFGGTDIEGLFAAGK